MGKDYKEAIKQLYSTELLFSAIFAVKAFDRIYETVGCVKLFLRTLGRALGKERHFALLEKLLPSSSSGSLLIVRSELLGST